DLLEEASHDVTGADLGKALHYNHRPERGDRADPLAHHPHEVVADGGGGAPHARLEDDEAQRDLALDRVGHAHDGALGDVGMGGEHLLHGPGGQPVAGYVDDVVGATHHPQVAVLVLVAGVGR